MKIAITGSSGSVGKAIVKMALAQGNDIVCIDRVSPKEALDTPHTFIQADMTDYDALVKAFRGCDAIVHMAAIPAPGHLPDHVVHNNNVVGSYCVSGLQCQCHGACLQPLAAFRLFSSGRETSHV
jgi:UDP-glucose 4-epimerase